MASKHFVMPTANAARLYPAHDEHPSDHVTVGVDPYDMADKAKIFSIPYGQAGFMPIFVVITNDSDQPLAIADAKTELVTVNHSRIPPATEEDIARRLTDPRIGSSLPSPVPWPKKVKGTFSKDQEEELESSRFAARAVEPHGTQAGFMFFDVSGITAPLAGASFVMTGVRDSKGNELMYFEIPMEKYLSAPSK
ncbi:MAG TPA: hypothetical protein VF753_15910 [Terriglobales bacterium]